MEWIPLSVRFQGKDLDLMVLNGEVLASYEKTPGAAENIDLEAGAECQDAKTCENLEAILGVNLLDEIKKTMAE